MDNSQFQVPANSPIIKKPGGMKISLWIAGFGAVVFLFGASILPFRNQLLNIVYPKADSQAEEQVTTVAPLTSPVVTSSPSASESATPGKVGDINVDGEIDLADLSFLLSLYGGSQTPPKEADLNNDTKVNAFDFGQLLFILRSTKVIK